MTVPTPPGTGVAAPATAATLSHSTSPTKAPATSLMPASITVAPGRIIAPVTTPGRPAAANTKSAWRSAAAKSGVRVWQTVTVAWRVSSRAASGRPTASPRPTTAARLPSGRTGTSASNSRQASGVAGSSASSSSPPNSSPRLTGVTPSTSLSGAIAPSTSRLSTPAGSGSSTRMPCTAGSWFQSRIAARRAAVVTPAGKRSTSTSIPSLRPSLALARAYHSEPGSAPASSTRRRGGCP